MNKINKFDIKKIFSKYEFQVDDIKKVKTGKFNQTFIGTVNNQNSKIKLNSNKIVLRIAPPDDAGFVFYEKNMMAREPAIHKLVADNTEIPIPEIYYYDNSRDIVNRDYLLMEYLSGTPLSEKKVSPEQKKSILKNTGKYLRELHKNCRKKKFGYPDGTNAKQGYNWSEVFSEMWKSLIDDNSRCGVYDQKETEKAKKIIDIHLENFNKDIEAVLLHMDVWSQNILVDNKGEITGIVDWDRALWGDPEIEFAVIDYVGFDKPSFWEGYGLKPDKTEEFKIRKEFYHLYEVQKYPVIWKLRGGETEKIKQYKKYCLNKIDRLYNGV